MVSFEAVLVGWDNQGLIFLILEGEGSPIGLTSCANMFYLAGISCISAFNIFFSFSKQTSQN